MQFNDFLLKYGKTVSYERSEYVFRQGSPDKYLYFVISGLLKAYYLKADGKVFIKSFIVENDIIGSLSSMFGNDECPFSLVCLEKCDLVKFDFKALQKTAATDIDIANTVINFLIRLSMKKERREYEFLCMNPEERYRAIQQENPGILNRVTQNDIAGFLGITPVALSRIRNRIAM